MCGKCAENRIVTNGTTGAVHTYHQPPKNCRRTHSSSFPVTHVRTCAHVPATHRMPFCARHMTHFTEISTQQHARVCTYAHKMHTDSQSTIQFEHAACRVFCFSFHALSLSLPVAVTRYNPHKWHNQHRTTPLHPTHKMNATAANTTRRAQKRHNYIVPFRKVLRHRAATLLLARLCWCGVHFN